MPKDLDQGSVEASALADPPLRPLTAREIVDEIVAYLPNPGQFQQSIVGAVADGDGAVLVTTASEQIFRLQVTEVKQV